jgi:DNA ligase-associated metallophosphoesterase
MLIMDESLSIRFGGADLRLLPDHAIWSPESATVWVADLHLGKEQTFRRAGLAVPDVLNDDLSRLTRVLESTAARHLVILGDLLHARKGRSEAIDNTVAEWRKRHASTDVTLIRGNHDRHAGDPSLEWRLTCVDAPTRLGNFTLAHYPPFDNASPALAGHLHPKFRLRSGAEDLKLPCFLIRRQTLVLPAFGQFIDHGFILPEPADHIYVVAGREVIPIHRDPEVP